MRYRWHPNALIYPLGNGLFRVFQPDSRRNIIANRHIATYADALTGLGMTHDELAGLHQKNGQDILLADATEFTIGDHVFKNSSMLGDVSQIQPVHISFEEFLELLLDAAILSDAWPPQDDFSKRHFADRFRGSFNEQLATEALLERSTPDIWWKNQKFAPDGELRETPYRHIQKPFLEEYFRRELSGLDALEIGCGTGYWTGRMAEHARVAVGMDINHEFLDAARTAWPKSRYPNIEFYYGNILDGGGLDLHARQFDRIFLVDIFLFLFAKEFQSDLYRRRHTVLSNIKRFLRPGTGRIVIMDPHLFWLTPWAGSQTRPTAFLTEYRHRRFKQIPTVSEYSELFHEAGLHIVRIHEPEIHTEYEAFDPSGYAFMREFPQWWVWELGF